MKALRSTVQELRVQEIDDIGLLTSLEGLMADHDLRGSGKTQFLLEAHGDVNALPLAITGHIFQCGVRRGRRPCCNLPRDQ